MRRASFVLLAALLVAATCTAAPRPAAAAYPPWDEGLAGGRWALVSKVHHCMVDGVASTDLMAVMVDAERNSIVSR